ncbi:TetR/AcrR family transcriptional regulator [Paractinoplanes ovalisporus]|uniref:TetR/AcrR family transcriptional regulator n=1 Tax=Paractinoplanes ovalisporus TaxID=2810368 RepID=UPI0027DCB426|nr:TetR family transcriptional regulator [Actinoplanes ovalisporus]
MPTGVALRDVRRQLFDAAERVLLRDGSNALTSRAVTAEAGCAKGVLHRHFADFDDFLVELVQRRIVGFEAWGATMRSNAGTGDVAENIADVLNGVLNRLGLALIGLIMARDELRVRLRGERDFGIPYLAEATEMIAGYLIAERDWNRVAEATDARNLALTLVGTAHLVAGEGNEIDPGLLRTIIGPAQ